MSIEYIQKLSMNPHFYALLLQGFLSGYNKTISVPCKVRLIFMALPIILYSESRKKLTNANTRSKMETLFNTPETLGDNTKISGKVKLSGYIKRFDELKRYSKKSLIILHTDKRILLKEYKFITLLKPIKYSDYNNIMKEWIKAAYYLGIIFAKTDENHLNYFLGVDRK